MANTKLSEIASGGALVPGTDTVVTVRSGSTDVLTTLGTISAQASNNVSITGGVLSGISSLNHVTVTDAGTSATLTLANGSSLITSGANAITLTSTGSTNVTLPTSGTLHSTTTQMANSFASVASTPAISMTGAVFSGGSATTTKPFISLQPSTATDGTQWSTNGTFIGINAPSGFAGNYMDFHTQGIGGGASLFSINAATAATNIGGTLTAAGTITTTGSFVASSSLTLGATNSVLFTGNARIKCTGTSAISIRDSGDSTDAALTMKTATISGNNGLLFTNQTTDAGAQTATMTNGPTAGNPAFWLRITVNGTNYAIPAWTA